MILASVTKKKKHTKRFERESGKSPLFKTFLLSCEGAVTERQYFSVFKDHKGIKIRSLGPKKGKGGNSPVQVLDRMEKAIKKHSLKTRDEAWIVIDTDQWTDDQFGNIQKWATQDASGIHRDVAISNPNFEYWLLLHFEDVKGGEAAEKCADQLKKLFPGYEKKIDTRKITVEMIKTAVDRAKARDESYCKHHPDAVGCTNVYKLVESILEASGKSAS